MQVLIALRFYATGAFQRVTGDLFGASVLATCTVIHKVSRTIAKQKGRFLLFPENLADSKRELYHFANFSLFSFFHFSPHFLLFTTIKVMPFFDWSFSHLHVPSLKLAEVTFDRLGFGSYIKLKFHAFGVFPNVFLSASAFYFWKVST